MSLTADSSLTFWLDYIDHIHPASVELGLSRVGVVAKDLAVTRFPIPVICVAGTNGKGSTVAILESILLAQGYQVGSYTSPHLMRFNERVRINAKPVNDEVLCQAFHDIELARRTTSLTYFEYTTLAALQIFKSYRLDVLILEVGMGGRLDATNVVENDIAVISSISFDHMKWLGNDLNSIAREKVGIVKTDKVLVYGDPVFYDSVKQQIQLTKAKVYQLDVDYKMERDSGAWNWLSQDKVINGIEDPHLLISNVANSLMVLSLLRQQLEISDAAILTGLQNAKVQGRIERISRDPTIIIDVSHNPASTRVLVEHLKNHYPDTYFHFCVGMLSDKDIKSSLAPFADLPAAWYVATLPSPRSASAELLNNVLKELGITTISHYENMTDGFDAALSHQTDKQVVVVFGSFFTVQAMLEYKSSFLQREIQDAC